MNKYFKFTVESDLGVGTQYIEFDEDNWAIRQAECHEGHWFNSSSAKYHSELGGISLFDQQLTEGGMRRGKSIDAREFELAWELSNKKLLVSHSTFPRRVDSSFNSQIAWSAEADTNLYQELDSNDEKVDDVSLDLLIPCDCPIRSNVLLKDLTTWKVGGLAQWYLEPRTLSEIQIGLAWARQHNLRITIIGAGSILLISDRGLSGLVICTRHLRNHDTQFDTETQSISADAGKMVASLAWQAARRGWGGMEWAVGIPGTVGGAVVMNAGAHGHSIQEILVNTEVLNLDGSIETLTNQDLNYSYRTSNLQNDSRIVLSAKFELNTTGDAEEIKARTFRDLEKRHSKQPYDRPSCGSVFRNPSPQYAAALIEGLGLKGHRIGDAEVSTLHANFIINRQDATASDIRELIFYVQSQVKAKHSIELEIEVKMLGEF